MDNFLNQRFYTATFYTATFLYNSFYFFIFGTKKRTLIRMRFEISLAYFFFLAAGFAGLTDSLSALPALKPTDLLAAI